jgi:hypothetical protein
MGEDGKKRAFEKRDPYFLFFPFSPLLPKLTP